VTQMYMWMRYIWCKYHMYCIYIYSTHMFLINNWSRVISRMNESCIVSHINEPWQHTCSGIGSGASSNRSQDASTAMGPIINKHTHAHTYTFIHIFFYAQHTGNGSVQFNLTYFQVRLGPGPLRCLSRLPMWKAIPGLLLTAAPVRP